MKDMFDGVGSVVIFNDDIRRGLALLDEYVFDAIKAGSERMILGAITKVEGQYKLKPTIVTTEQLRLVIKAGYEHVLSRYPFFNSVPRDFEDWVVAETIRRIRSQTDVAEYEGVTNIDDSTVNAIIEKRQEAFRAFTMAEPSNPAKQRKIDRDDLRDIALMRLSAHITIERVSRNSGKSIGWLKEKFASTEYLTIIRRLVAKKYRKESGLKRLKEINPSKFADRMGIKKQQSIELLQDLIAQKEKEHEKT